MWNMGIANSFTMEVRLLYENAILNICLCSVFYLYVNVVYSPKYLVACLGHWRSKTLGL